MSRRPGRMAGVMATGAVVALVCLDTLLHPSPAADLCAAGLLRGSGCTGVRILHYTALTDLVLGCSAYLAAFIATVKWHLHGIPPDAD